MKAQDTVNHRECDTTIKRYSLRHGLGLKKQLNETETMKHPVRPVGKLLLRK